MSLRPTEISPQFTKTEIECFSVYTDIVFDINLLRSYGEEKLTLVCYIKIRCVVLQGNR